MESLSSSKRSYSNASGNATNPSKPELNSNSTNAEKNENDELTSQLLNFINNNHSENEKKIKDVQDEISALRQLNKQAQTEISNNINTVSNDINKTIWDYIKTFLVSVIFIGGALGAFIWSEYKDVSSKIHSNELNSQRNTQDIAFVKQNSADSETFKIEINNINNKISNIQDSVKEIKTKNSDISKRIDGKFANIK
ncbi:hypothetical protein [Photobacterium sanguinicancri]|uniref:Uncharacterized protein n=1 Tax=Photobacterium sanguinicancri TaxID=875932 RepID=A0AAW7Y9P8_9GAMM|nr:hypothetical protein [Photobacterium sanguinicancri]MDO6543484.1 hypothetical protein [Photobacterium sanguinicancri]